MIVKSNRKTKLWATRLPVWEKNRKPQCDQMPQLFLSAGYHWVRITCEPAVVHLALAEQPLFSIPPTQNFVQVLVIVEEILVMLKWLSLAHKWEIGS